MIKPLTLLAALLALASPCGAEVHVLDFDTTPPAGQLSASDIPSGAGHYVLDEADSLAPKLRIRAESTLSENTIAPTYLVIKQGKAPVAVDLYGNELLRRWIISGRHLGALIMTVTEPLPATHVILAGRNLDKTDRRRLHALGSAALALGSKHADQAEGAVATALALVPALATYAAAYTNAPTLIAETASATVATETGAAAVPPTDEASAEYIPVTISHWDQLSAKLDWPLIRAVSIIVGGLMILVFGAIFLPRALRPRRLLFPEIEPRTRFSAPFAGGNNAQIKFRS